MKYKMLTSGRIAKEFHKLVNKFEDISCTFIENEKEARSRISEFDALAGISFFQGEDLSHLKWLHLFTAGVDHIIDEPSLTNVTVTRTIGYMPRKMGEYCLAYALYLLNNIEVIRDNQKKNTWEKHIATPLYNKKVLIFGTGRIGEGIAEVFKPLTTNVTGVSRSGRSTNVFDKVLKVDDLIEVGEFDYVINALPLTEETKGFFDAQIFANFSNAVFMNVGRGASVVEKDLLEAISKGYISQAVLDVFTDEPLSSTSNLWSHDKILITPHQAAYTDFHDVEHSFRQIYKALKSGERNEFLVDTAKGY